MLPSALVRQPHLDPVRATRWAPLVWPMLMFQIFLSLVSPSMGIWRWEEGGKPESVIDFFTSQPYFLLPLYSLHMPPGLQRWLHNWSSVATGRSEEAVRKLYLRVCYNCPKNRHPPTSICTGWVPSCPTFESTSWSQCCDEPCTRKAYDGFFWGECTLGRPLSCPSSNFGHLDCQVDASRKKPDRSSM